MFCDTGRCRASIKAGRQGGDAGAQGKPQPDAHGWRELKGTDAFSRTAGRKITADGKEGPGDRRVHFTLASPPARLRWRHGTARTRHNGHRVETPQGHALHGRVKAEPAATSFDIPHRVHSQGKWRGENVRRWRTSVPVPGRNSPSWQSGCSCPRNASKEKGTAGKWTNRQSLHKGASVQSDQHQP